MTSASNYMVVLSTRVDLEGQLSNPCEKLETLAKPGVARSMSSSGPIGGSERAPRGRLSRSSSSPVRAPAREAAFKPSPGRTTRQHQQRLKTAEIDQLVESYLAGDLIRDIAARFGVSRTTVVGHVGVPDGRGIPHDEYCVSVPLEPCRNPPERVDFDPTGARAREGRWRT